MSFYTSLTGLNAATAQLSVTSNNIANVGTTGFKRSRADFGDIFATSPLQKASSVIGQGVALKQVSQEFSQGNIQFSANSLDIAITGDGFFPLKSADGLQDIYTRNGTFMLNDSYNVVNAAGQALIAAAVDSSGKADLENLSKLLIPRKTTGDAVATSEVQLGLNLPADAKVPVLPFDKNDDTTYNKTTAVTVYDAGGNGYLATVYYRKTQVATPEDPSNKWQTYVYIGDTKLQELLIQSSDKKSGEKQYVNKYGEVRNESDIPPQDIARGVTKLFNLDDLKNPQLSSAATVRNGVLTDTLISQWKSGIDFPDQVNAYTAIGANLGATYTPVVNADSYTLNTRSTIQDNTAVRETKINKLEFTPDPAASTFSLTLGDTYTGSDLDALVASIIAGGKYNATNIAGKLSISLTGASGDPTEINPAYALTAVLPSSTEPVAQEATEATRITKLTFSAAATTDSPKLTIGSDTYTAGTLQELAAAINSVGNYTATFTTGTPNATLVVGLTGTVGDPTEINANFKLSSITDSLVSTDLEAMAAVINENKSLTYFASFNAAGEMILLPKDETVPPVIPDFSMVANVLDGYEIRSTTKATDELKYDIEYLSSDLTLKIGTNTFSGMTLEALVNDIRGVNVDNPTGDPDRTYDAIIAYNSDGSKSLTIIPFAANATIPADTSLETTALGVNSNPGSMVFDMRVDGSATPITVDLSYLGDLALTRKFTGVEIAREITNTINKAYGDQRYFDFTTLKPTEDAVTANLFRLNVGAIEKTISLNENQFDIADLSKVKLDEAVSAMQAAIDKEIDFPAKVTVGYDPVRQTFTFKAGGDTSVAIRSATLARNELFGLTSVESTVDASTGSWGSAVLPNGASIIDAADQRYGVEVKFDETNKAFTISSGRTGDTSSIEISKASALAHVLFGFQRSDTAVEVETSSTPLRGITSEPAVLSGNTIGINLDNKFRVDGSNNQFVVTVDNVTGLITMPEKADYTMEEFRQELERRVNALADNFGRTVNGVTVEIDSKPGTNSKFFKFTTGTTGDNSFLKVSANSIWGLNDLPAARGTTSKWIEPPQAKNGDGFPLYVDRDGLETPDPGSFSEDESRDLWSPIFLDKGEMTFDTAGKLFSPQEAISFKSTTIGASGATLQFSIDYASSTQYSSPFSVLKQDQNGRPEGDLIGVDIGDDGLVSASYSNGTQKSLAKIVLVNFAAPTGLRQIGDASYYATSKSGDAKYGEAGSAGFGTVRAGARERANVDLTAELVELITAQRNFQANAKAIETNNTLTQAIINIRS
ncbi:MAG: flagellar hook-basal body complex protein [Oxalobacteraceae bacterium]|nr:flagellar hook-basal body complex protein [Oxalobacteraceae bacterium]